MNDCDKKIIARGLCGTHYARWRKHGTTEKRVRQRNTCSVDGCGGFVRGNNMCSEHYDRMRRYGSLEPRRRKQLTIHECARDGCENDVIWQPSTSRKYCSTNCYQATPRQKYAYETRVCDHCAAEYTPKGPTQRYCYSCIGPTVYSKGGHSRSLGLLRLKKYGVTHVQWKEMVARYAGACWICREKSAAVLDHCHATGKPRGALCHGCNSQLGALDRVGWLEKARAYLDEVGV